MSFKQVIILRKDLNMRKGKMVAQGAHASIAALEKASPEITEKWKNGYNGIKICVGVNSEVELYECFNNAKRLGLPASLILDVGYTEFKEPTHTAVAIGPGPSEVIDCVTGSLKLL